MATTFIFFFFNRSHDENWACWPESRMSTSEYSGAYVDSPCLCFWVHWHFWTYFLLYGTAAGVAELKRKGNILACSSCAVMPLRVSVYVQVQFFCLSQA